MTPHEIFWKTEVLHKQCLNRYKPEIFTAPKDVENISLATLREHMDALQNLSDNLRNYFGGNSLRKEHYWHGLSLAGPVEFARGQDLILLLKTLHSTAKQAKISLERLQCYNLDTGALKTYKLERLEESDFAYAHLFSFLDLDNIQNEINGCLALLQAYQSNLEILIVSLEKSNLKLNQVAGLDPKIVYDCKLPSSLSFKEVQAISDRINPALMSFKDGQHIFREAAHYLGLSDHLDSISTIQTIVQVAAYCLSVEVDTLSHRNPVIEQAMSDSFDPEHLIYKIESLCSLAACSMS
jgi:hypothetical protein